MIRGDRLLFVRRGGLGDTLLMVPLLRVLARAHPAAELHFAGVHEFAGLLVHFGVVARALSSEGLAVWTLPRQRASEARQRLQSYQHIVADDPAFGSVAAATTQVRCFDPRPRDHRPLPLQIAEQLQLPLCWPADACLRDASPGSSRA